VGIAIGSVGIAFIGGVLCAGVCAPDVLGVDGVLGAEVFMPERLDGVLGVLLPGACAWPAAVGCDAFGGVAGAPALLPVDVDSCASAFGALPAPPPQAAMLMSSAASWGRLLRRECLSE